jgi:hypothetical protein
MIRRTTHRRANGHAAPLGRPNGHGPAIAERGGVPATAFPGGGDPGFAASDDTGGSPSADPAALAASDSTDRQEYAAAAPPPPHTESRTAKKEKPQAAEEEFDDIAPGEAPLPSNVADFVEEIHRRVDLFAVWQKLLRTKDLKIKQRAAERLTDLRYKGAASAEEPQQILFDLPRPKLD